MIWISTLERGDLGALSRPSFEAQDEVFLRALVSEPESVVAVLADLAVEAWVSEQAALVAELASAVDDRARASIKRRLPAFVPARFSDCRRVLSSFVSRQTIAYDFDCITGSSFEDAVAVVRAALPDHFLAVHTTPSERNADGTWRLRAFELLERPATLEEWNGAVKPRMRAAGSDEAALDASRLIFLPLRTNGYRFAIFEGPRTPMPATLEAPRTGPSTGNEPVFSRARETPLEARRALAAQLLGSAWPPRGQRHVAQLALAGALKRDGWSPDLACDFLSSVCRVAGDEDRPKRELTIADTWASNAHTTGWTALERYVDRGVLSAARGLADRDADARHELGSLASSLASSIASSLAAAPAQDTLTLSEALAKSPEHLRAPSAPAAAGATKGGLGFEFGAWTSEPPPIDFLIDGLIPRGAVVMLYGRADSLKTWLAYSAALALANGTPWLGRLTKPTKVGIVDYETGGVNLRRRLYMLRAGASKNLGAVSFTSLKPNHRDFWVALAKEDFEVVFIDSLRRSNPGADENDSGESIVPLEMAAEFSELTGCAVVWIHHAKKASGDGWPEFRGSAAIEDQVDCAYSVKKSDLDSVKRRIDVRCEKPGDMRSPEPFAVEVEFDDEARLATVRVAPPEGAEAPGAAEASKKVLTDLEIRAAVKLALASGPVETREKIRARIDASRGRVLMEINALIELEEVVEISGKGFVLDNPEARRARVLAQVREFAGWASSAKLADAAFVSRRFVETMLRDGEIARSVLGGGETGGFVAR